MLVERAGDRREKGMRVPGSCEQQGKGCGKKASRTGKATPWRTRGSQVQI